MTTYLNHQLVQHRIDDLHAEAENRRLVRAARQGRPSRWSVLRRLLARHQGPTVAVKAEWWDGTVAAPGRGLPA